MLWILRLRLRMTLNRENQKLMMPPPKGGQIKVFLAKEDLYLLDNLPSSITYFGNFIAKITS